MIHYASYSVSEVHSAVEQNSTRLIRINNGPEFKRSSGRIELFMTKGLACVTCGIAGEVYVLESVSENIRPHLNLYARDEKGNLILMTKDHIHPKSKGGRDELANYATMCSPCNAKKADKLVH